MQFLHIGVTLGYTHVKVDKKILPVRGFVEDLCKENKRLKDRVAALEGGSVVDVDNGVDNSSREP